MPDIKHTMIFQLGNHGWTESWLRTSTDTLDQAFGKITSLAILRGKLLGLEAAIIGLRVAYATPGMTGAVVQAVAIGPFPEADHCDEQDAALLVTCQTADRTQKKQVYLRGIWDNIDVNGGKFVGPQVAGWNPIYQSWMNSIMQGGWGWLGRNTKDSALVQTYTIGAGGQIQFTLKTPLFLLGLIGSKQTVRISGLGNNSVLNGSQVVTVDAIDKFTLYKATAAFPYTTGGNVTFSTKKVIVPGFIQPRKIATRRTGAVFFGSRGRRKARGRG